MSRALSSLLVVLTLPLGAFAADDAPTRTADPQGEYEKQYVWFEDYKLVNLNSGQQVGEGATPYQGKYKKKLEDDAFYDAVGRKDLGDKYRSVNGTKLGLYIGGGAVAIAAPLVTLGLMSSIKNPTEPASFTESYPQYDPTGCFGQSNEQACIDQYDAQHDAAVATYEQHRAAHAAAETQYTNDFVAAQAKRDSYLPIMYAGAGVGLAAMAIGALINPHPVALEERRQLADEYNQGLKKKLGAPVNDDPAKPAPTDFVTELRLDGAVTPVGSAITLSGRF